LFESEGRSVEDACRWNVMMRMEIDLRGEMYGFIYLISRAYSHELTSLEASTSAPSPELGFSPRAYICDTIFVSSIPFGNGRLV
jgi:hypothetical protein